MSVYVSKLNRQGIDWAAPGYWQRGMGVNRLETFAKNLDVSGAPQTDLLNSVPTPWARLLLFEAALYDRDHPAHYDIVDQWRGLLGVIALSELLHLRFDAARIIELSAVPGESSIRDAFLTLRPQHHAAGDDQDLAKWDRFNLISVDQQVIGATSPRTLVFSGISHQCPESVPFRSTQGRLSDPLRYYRKFNDLHFLSLLAQWLDVLIDRVRNSQRLRTLMGTVPVSYGQVTNRIDLLIRALGEWRAEFAIELPAGARAPEAGVSPFPNPYSVLRPVPRSVNDPMLNQSDLFLEGHGAVIVCFRPAHQSVIRNRAGMEVTDDQIRIYDGHWIESSESLPDSLSFLPALPIINDPAAFLESALIEAPLRGGKSYSLEFEGASYLLPYKKEILDYLSPAEIAANTSLKRLKANHITLELVIPLVNHRSISVKKHYREDDDVISLSKSTPDALAFWPGFICTEEQDGQTVHHQRRYFYYRFSRGGTATNPALSFEPLGAPATERRLPLRTWFETNGPLIGFEGSVYERKGLLLIHYEELPPPNRQWKVAVDLGSTHTRSFSLEVERQGNRWLATDGAQIRPIEIAPEINALTQSPPTELVENFFGLEGVRANREEFMSQLVLPQPNNENHPDWLPREGSIFRQSLLDGFPQNAFRHNFKWNSDTSDYALRAFLRCLLVIVEAAALRQRAKVVSVSHSHPSVFTESLVQKHRNEWDGLGIYSGLPIDPPLSEAEAVGRYLQVGEGAVVTENTIALDVGGSTTDIAIWSRNQLSRQESVKMAAGVVGRYVQTEPGLFKDKLVQILGGQPFQRTLVLKDYEHYDAGYSLMFNAVLNSVTASGQLDALVMSIMRSSEGQLLIAHLMYVFGALLYYVGILCRKMKINDQSQYYLYFCGKGGQFIEWIQNREKFVAEMFGAGLSGPGGLATANINVASHPSGLPKQEVGRGLLAQSALTGRQNGPEGGLVNLLAPTVTVGEEGYKDLTWSDQLTGKALTSLPLEVPPYNSLLELKNFIEAFASKSSTHDAAMLLGLTGNEPPDFRARLKERLFGSARGRVVYDIQHHPDEALLESLFITEAKVLLETITKNHRLFT